MIIFLIFKKNNFNSFYFHVVDTFNNGEKSSSHFSPPSFFGNSPFDQMKMHASLVNAQFYLNVLNSFCENFDSNIVIHSHFHKKSWNLG